MYNQLQHCNVNNQLFFVAFFFLLGRFLEPAVSPAFLDTLLLLASFAGLQSI